MGRGEATQETMYGILGYNLIYTVTQPREDYGRSGRPR